MMTAPPSADKADTEMVPLARPSDALGGTLRDTFAVPPMPAEWVELLRQLDRRIARH